MDQVAVHLGVYTTQGSPPVLENESLLALVDFLLLERLLFSMAEKEERGSVHPGSKPWQRADTAHESVGPWLYHQQMLGLGYPRDQAQDGMGAEKEEPQTKRSFMSHQPLPCYRCCSRC